MQKAVRSTQQRADTLGIYRGNLSALQVLAEISSRVPSDLDVIFEELSIDRQVIQIKGHSPSFGSVDRLRAELTKYGPFSEIAVGDITSDARRGGQTFNVRISLASGSEAS
jgi:general secretion pathway protein L